MTRQPPSASSPTVPAKGDALMMMARRLLDEWGDPQEAYRAGDVVQFPAPDGRGRYAGTVLQVGHEGDATAVLFDFNHPLAGQAVRFEARVIGVL